MRRETRGLNDLLPKQDVPGGRQSMFVCEWTLRSFPMREECQGGRLIALAGRLNAPVSCWLGPEVVNNYLGDATTAKCSPRMGLRFPAGASSWPSTFTERAGFFRKSGEPAHFSELIIGRFSEVNTIVRWSTQAVLLVRPRQTHTPAKNVAISRASSSGSSTAAK